MCAGSVAAGEDYSRVALPAVLDLHKHLVGLELLGGKGDHLEVVTLLEGTHGIVSRGHFSKWLCHVEPRTALRGFCPH